MLQVASFDISDDKAINELLSRFRIAQGASILVSDGKVCIPYEDGEPLNNSQIVAQIKEQKNSLLSEKNIIEHSLLVVKTQVEEYQEELNQITADLEEAKAGNNKKGKSSVVAELEKKQKFAQGRVDQIENQVNTNTQEIHRIDLNIALFDKRIAELG